jgi:xanthosine utilization system XapX-like protein
MEDFMEKVIDHVYTIILGVAMMVGIVLVMAIIGMTIWTFPAPSAIALVCGVGWMLGKLLR